MTGQYWGVSLYCIYLILPFKITRVYNEVECIVPSTCANIEFSFSISGVIVTDVWFQSLLQIPENYGGVRMLSQGKGGMILVGTTRNCILQGTVDLQLNPIVQVQWLHSVLLIYMICIIIPSFLGKILVCLSGGLSVHQVPLQGPFWLVYSFLVVFCIASIHWFTSMAYN